MKVINMVNNNIKLFRTVNQKIRYYKITLFKNLFDEYLVTREYGSIKNKKPTGVKTNYFFTKDESIEFIEKLLMLKIKKGYCEFKK